ncbi:Glutathione S-transferase [Tieghemiomyces parasiticus]|uniref:glutathione transferase n=1 Tax=Tieghemiomyces parasiticus TaxID=78921 RepID=A0A9W8A0T0_9FUNG|nr:Glutathione S-transferase [Tieghemiomyces parasiticus]
MVKYELFYFHMAARAEPIRAILDYANVNWTNRAPKEWPAEKDSTPFGQLPVFTETYDQGGQLVLTESQAIERYLARKFGLYGFHPVTDVRIDIVTSQWETVMNFYYGSLFVKSQEEFFKGVFLAQAKILFVKHGEQLAKQGNGYYVGDKITWADLVGYVFLAQIKEGPYYDEELKTLAEPLEKYLVATLEKDPNFQRYQTLSKARLAQ